MSLRGRKNHTGNITVAELRECVYCPRAWAYSSRNVRPHLPPEQVAVVEQRQEAGWQYHRQHGEAVCLASLQRRRAVSWWYIGLAAAVLAGAVLVWGR